MFERTTNYPVILVPGVLGYGDESYVSKVLPYFGLTSANVEKTIRSLDTECYTATFGKVSGIWDRACELYAQIKGGTVDYGAAHAEKYGTKRYGRTYKGFVPDWGKDGKKITLIAHGFGAPVARLLVYLMANGSKKEQASGVDDMSPLFEGGHYRAVHAVVTLAGNNDGSTLYQAIDYRITGAYKAMTTAAFLFDQASNAIHGGVLKDRAPATVHGSALSLDLNASGLKNKVSLKSEVIDDYLANTRDNIFWEMSLDGMADFNKCVSINPQTYYFAFTGEVTRDYMELLPQKSQVDKFTTVLATKEEDKKQFILPKLKAGILAPTSALISTFKNYLPDGPIVDETMAANDGFINTNTSMAPSTETMVDYDGQTCDPGVWYQMPIEEKNHLRYLGLGIRADKFRDEIYDFLEFICNLEEV